MALRSEGKFYPDRVHSVRAQQSAQHDEFSKAQLNLSFNDRNAINEEIHGVSCMAPEESPELINSALYGLNLELNTIQEKSAYNRAQEMYRTGGGGVGQHGYVNTNAFRLRFLRCELFDTKKAAARMVKYLDLMYNTFGPYALTRPVRLSDLSREEMSFLRGGDYQLLAYRDRSGRRLLCIVTNNRDDISADTRKKILLYLWFVAGEDVESQRKGMVVVSYSGPKITSDEEEKKNTKQQKFHSSRVTTHAVVGAAVPMRLVAVHFCLPDSGIFHVLTKIYAMALGNWSARVKFHLGKSVELRYQLRSYGIPTELIPSTDTGNVKHVNLKQWIKLREFLEKYPNATRRLSLSSESGDDGMDYEYTGNSVAQGYRTQQQQQQYYQMQQYQQQLQYANQYQIQQQQGQQQPQRMVIVECPGCNDVIFRRGKSMTYHPGNVMFQSLIESKLEEHTNANQAGKMSIVLSLIQHIQQEKGGRFLTWDAKNNWWMDMMTIPMSGTHNSPSGLFQAQELEIQSKVNYAFRDFKKKLKTQEALQVTKSSTYAFERQDGAISKRRKANRSAMDGCFCSDSDNTEGES